MKAYTEKEKQQATKKVLSDIDKLQNELNIARGYIQSDEMIASMELHSMLNEVRRSTNKYRLIKVRLDGADWDEKEESYGSPKISFSLPQR